MIMGLMSLVEWRYCMPAATSRSHSSASAEVYTHLCRLSICLYTCDGGEGVSTYSQTTTLNHSDCETGCRYAPHLCRFSICLYS